MFETGKGKIFVLIHGTWHGGWALKDVIHQLSEKGHTAHAPTLAGHGPGAVRSGVKHQDCVDSVAEYIQQLDLKDIALVGHSFGGTIVQKVAEQFPERIARIVFLDALVLKGNEPQLLCNSLEGIGQHYTLPRIGLTGVVLDPSLPVAS